MLAFSRLCLFLFECSCCDDSIYKRKGLLEWLKQNSWTFNFSHGNMPPEPPSLNSVNILKPSLMTMQLPFIKQSRQRQLWFRGSDPCLFSWLTCCKVKTAHTGWQYSMFFRLQWCYFLIFIGGLSQTFRGTWAVGKKCLMKTNYISNPTSCPHPHPVEKWTVPNE